MIWLKAPEQLLSGAYSDFVNCCFQVQEIITVSQLLSQHGQEVLKFLGIHEHLNIYNYVTGDEAHVI